MRTILGANGQIARELEREIARNYPTPLYVVSRRSEKVNATDQLMAADLMDPSAAAKATAGSAVAYLTVGLPIDSSLWERQSPVIMQNVLDACIQRSCRLVFFDNTNMYAKTAAPQAEDSPFVPVGRKQATGLLSEALARAFELPPG